MPAVPSSKPGTAAQGELLLGGESITFSNPQYKWEVRWADIIELGSQSHHKDPSKKNFYLCSRERCYPVPFDWLPEEELKRHFRSIAEKAASRRVLLDDELGWASDLQNKFWRPEGFPDPETEALMGKWHDNTEKRLPTAGLKKWGHILFGIGAVLAAALIPVAVFIATGSTRMALSLVLGVLGGVCLGGGLFLLVMVSKLERLRLSEPAAIRFDAGGIEGRFPAGAEKRIEWDKVQRVRRNIPAAGGLVLRLEDGIWTGGFPAEVTEAVRKLSLASRPKH